MVVKQFPSWRRAEVELHSLEFFLKGLGNMRTSLAILDNAPYSIGRAVYWEMYFEVNLRRKKNIKETFGGGYYFQGSFRVGLPYSVVSEEGLHSHILY